MSTVPLTLHGLTWCWRHGHPIVGLCARPDEVFWVTLSTDDAQALSPMYQGHNTGRARLYELLESTIESLGARISGITLGLSHAGGLHASLTIEGVFGRLARPVNTVDAIVLAHRGQVTIEIDEQDLLRICPDDHHDTQQPGAQSVAEADETPASFRAFIESLDLGQLDRPDLR